MRLPALLVCLVAGSGALGVGVGCAALPSTATPLEAEVRRLRTEQERQAQQIEMLQNRLVLTEDTARQARNAVEGIGHRATIHLGAEPTRTDRIQVDATGSSDDPGGESTATGPELPRVRITGAERIPERPAFVVHESERLPVVPLAPPPGAGTPAAPVPPAPGYPPTAQPPVGIPVPAPASGTLDPRAAEAYDAALALARAGRCDHRDGAIEAFAAFLVRWPDHPHADNAMYWRGECFARTGDTRRAITEWEGLLSRFPTGNKVSDALYKLSVSYRRLGDTAAADRASQRLMDEFPDSDAARRMRTERQRP